MASGLVVFWLAIANIFGANAGYTRTTFQLSGRIIGGTDAPANAYPYQVSLQNLGRHVCGGSIIANEWVVTAAHCATEYALPDLTVYAGSSKLSSGGTRYAVLEVLPHEKYDAELIKNDVALLKVESMAYTNNVRPILLDSEAVGDNEPCTLSGWGITSFPGFSPDNLQHINLTTVPFEFCRNQHPRPVAASELCTFSRLGEGACYADSGGPLVRNVNGTTKQIGIVSWGQPCALGIPDVFARVSFFVDWFRKKCSDCM